MRRILWSAVGAGAVVLIVFAGIAPGASGGARVKVARSLVAIKERNNPNLNASNAITGRFRLELDGVVVDSGRTTVVLSNVGGLKTVGGQPQSPVVGSNTLSAKKGTLVLAFRGINIAVDSSPSGAQYGVEYGSWTITSGTGTYKGWRGGGLWANASTPSADNVEWDGYVTH